MKQFLSPLIFYCAKSTFGTALARYNGLEKLNDGQYVKFVEIICVQGSEIVHRTTL